MKDGKGSDGDPEASPHDLVAALPTDWRASDTRPQQSPVTKRTIAFYR